jgi:hypothetical protein
MRTSTLRPVDFAALPVLRAAGGAHHALHFIGAQLCRAWPVRRLRLCPWPVSRRRLFSFPSRRPASFSSFSSFELLLLGFLLRPAFLVGQFLFRLLFGRFLVGAFLRFQFAFFAFARFSSSSRLSSSSSVSSRVRGRCPAAPAFDRRPAALRHGRRRRRLYSAAAPVVPGGGAGGAARLHLHVPDLGHLLPAGVHATARSAVRFGRLGRRAVAGFTSYVARPTRLMLFAKSITVVLALAVAGDQHRVVRMLGVQRGAGATRARGPARLRRSARLLAVDADRQLGVGLDGDLDVVSGGWVDFSALGRLITLGFWVGGTTMKMMSSTSITSMYGTTLISDLSLRRVRRACC